MSVAVVQSPSAVKLVTSCSLRVRSKSITNSYKRFRAPQPHSYTSPSLTVTTSTATYHTVHHRHSFSASPHSPFSRAKTIAYPILYPLSSTELTSIRSYSTPSSSPVVADLKPTLEALVEFSKTPKGTPLDGPLKVLLEPTNSPWHMLYYCRRNTAFFQQLLDIASDPVRLDAHKKTALEMATFSGNAKDLEAFGAANTNNPDDPYFLLNAALIGQLSGIKTDLIIAQALFYDRSLAPKMLKLDALSERERDFWDFQIRHIPDTVFHEVVSSTGAFIPDRVTGSLFSTQRSLPLSPPAPVTGIGRFACSFFSGLENYHSFFLGVSPYKTEHPLFISESLFKALRSPGLPFDFVYTLGNVGWPSIISLYGQGLRPQTLADPRVTSLVDPHFADPERGLDATSYIFHDQGHFQRTNTHNIHPDNANLLQDLARHIRNIYRELKTMPELDHRMITIIMGQLLETPLVKFDFETLMKQLNKENTFKGFRAKTTSEMLDIERKLKRIIPTTFKILRYFLAGQKVPYLATM